MKLQGPMDKVRAQALGAKVLSDVLTGADSVEDALIILILATSAIVHGGIEKGYFVSSAIDGETVKDAVVNAVRAALEEKV